MSVISINPEDENGEPDPDEYSTDQFFGKMERM